MNAPNSPQSSGAPISKAALWTMIILLAGMLLVALHMNFVRWQRDKIEKVIVTPVATPTASPPASPDPSCSGGL